MTTKLELGQMMELLDSDYDLTVQEVPGGLLLRDEGSEEEIILWHQEIEMAIEIGDGGALTGLLIYHMIDGKFDGTN